MIAQPTKRTGFFVALALVSMAQLVAVAHSAPVPNLALTCSDENAIGQNPNACHGILAYQIVDKTGGDYTDPATAAQNTFAGGAWYVAPQWPAQPCAMAIGDGVYILKETLNIPAGFAVTGAGKGATLLVADNAVYQAARSIGDVRISDLTRRGAERGGYTEIVAD